jgi:VCBS repeat-containing protein
MTNGTSQTPPPPPTGGPAYGAAPPSPGKKKGLSPLAWVGIGCGVIVVLGLIVMVVAGALGMRWLGGKAKEFEANPGLAAAKLVISVNPELELVDTDEDAGTLTVRNTKTGEIMKATFDENGKVTFESNGETTSFGMEKGDDGEGAFTVRGADGKTRLRVGAGGEEDLPGWLPRYEGVTPQGTYFSASGGTVNGGYSFETADSVDDVIGYFRDELEDAGMTETGNSNTTSGSSRFSNVSYEGDGRTVTLVVTSDGDETNVIVSYSAPEEE